MIRARGGPLLVTAVTATTREAEAKISVGGRSSVGEAALSIGRTGGLQKDLTLPPLSPAATRMAALTALEDRLPFPPAEACLACRRRRDGRVVEVVVARRAFVEEARAFLLTLGLRPRRLDLRPAALTATLRFGYGTELTGHILVLELRQEESAGLFFHHDRLVYAHPLPGLGREENDAKPVEAFCRDLRLAVALMGYGGDRGGPDAVWLTGPLAHRSGVKEAVATTLALSPEEIRIVGPRGLLRRPGLPPPGPETTAAVGSALLALGYETAPPNLLAGLDEGSAGVNRRSLALPLGLALVFAVAGSYFLAAARQREAEVLTAWLDEKKEEILRLRQVQEETANLTARLELLSSFGGESGEILEVLLALQRVLPAGTRLTRITMAGGQIEAVEGITPSLSSLLAALAREPLLAGLRLRGRAGAVEGEAGEHFILAGPIGKEGRR